MKELLAREETAASKREDGPSMKDLMQEWIDASRPRRSARTIKEEYLPTANEYIEVNGDHPVRTFSLRQTDRLVAKMSGRGLANPTINKRLQCINAFLVWCVERGELDRKPRIRLLKTDRRMPGRLTGEQLQALFDRIAMGPSRPENQWSYRLNHRFLTVAAATGARRAEIFWLPWARIDFKREVIYVQKSKRMQVKERKDKTLPMPPRFRDYLLCERESYPGEVWLLDNGRGDLFYSTPGGISRAFSRHYAALGIKGVKPIHGLRASFADYLLNLLQLPISDVQRWLGHEYETTTLLYASDEGGRLRKAAQSIGSLSPVTPLALPEIPAGRAAKGPPRKG